MTRFAPLAGVAFSVLVLVGGPVLEGNAPSASASGAKVIAFYTAHRAKERAGAIVLAFAFLAILVFAGAMRERWRCRREAEGVATVVLAATVVLVVGQTTAAGIGFALTDSPASLSAASAQTLNRLSNDLVLTSAVGFLAFGVLSGLIVLGTRTAPAWLGWFAIVTGLLFVVPALEFAGFFALIVWVTVLSVITFRRGANTAPVAVREAA